MKSVADIKNARRELIKVAQHEYDQWDESDVDTYAGGGICHIIADAMAGVLIDHGIECSTVSSDMEVHVYVVAQVKEGVYLVDIPYSTYETGGGYSWKKIADVVFNERDIVIDRLDADPNEYEKYLSESLKTFAQFLGSN